MSSLNGTLVRVEGVSKFFRRGSEEIHVLESLDLTVPTGDYLALMGPSGSGKTTLLNLIGGLDRPTEGGVREIASIACLEADSRSGAAATSALCFSSITFCRCCRRSGTSSFRFC